MRILLLSAWFPLPADNGSRVRIAQLLRTLGGRHEVELLCFAPDSPSSEALRELEQTCAGFELVRESPFKHRALGRLRGLASTRPSSEVASFSPAMAAAVRRRVRRGYDLVIASQLKMAPYALLLPDVPRLLEEVELGVLRDLYARERRLLARVRHGLMWWKARRYVRAILLCFAAATVVSEPERELLEPLASPRTLVRVIPNGVDVDAFRHVAVEPDADTLVYPGALSYQANVDAVAFFAGSILPRIRAQRPATRLLVTGPTTRAQVAALPTVQGLELTGYLADARPTIARSWAEVVPLRIGGGTRVKVLEALALGTPVVSTSKGVEGLQVEAGRHLLVADSPADFAAATLQLLAQPDLRQRLAAAGSEVVAERYDWRIVSRGLDELLLELAARRPRLGRSGAARG